MTPEKARRTLDEMQRTVRQANKIIAMDWLAFSERYRANVIKDHALQIMDTISDPKSNHGLIPGQDF